MYRQITSPADQFILQDDFNRLTTWSSLWQMEFNVKNYNDQQRKPYISPYFMHNQPLKNVKTFDYLGVRLSSNLPKYTMHEIGTKETLFSISTTE